MVAEFHEYNAMLQQDPRRDLAPIRTPAPIRYEQFLGAVNSAAVHYQPIIDIRSNSAVGAEALIRPQTIFEGMGLQDFIQYAQDNDFVPRITEVVLKDVLQRARSSSPAFSVEPPEDAPVYSYTVNVSPACLKDQTCIDLTNQFLHLAGRRFNLVLELSEVSVFPIDLLDSFHEKTGRDERLTFALDDFGIGQSRFENLSCPLVKWAKIDKSFLSFKEDENMFRTLKAIVEFAQFFNCEIVVEGIETQMQMDLISRLDGVKLAQGFLLGRPAPWQ